MYWFTGIIGILFVLAPFLFGYTENTAALWTSVVIGLLVIGVSTIERIAEGKDMWEYWVAGILGLLAIASPFLFGFTEGTTAMWTAIGSLFLVQRFFVRGGDLR